MWTIATIVLVIITLRFFFYIADWAAYKDAHRNFHNGRPKAYHFKLDKPKFINFKNHKKCK